MKKLLGLILLCHFLHAADEKAITQSESKAGPEEVWGVESTERQIYLYPSNWGSAGIFRVRSAESLPEDALTFGIGGEFYSVNSAPVFYSSSEANTIAESLFIGYSPLERLTVSLMRRSSSTTFGNPPRLISSLGDFNLQLMYSIPISPIIAVAPIGNLMIASNFNDLAPAGSTVSGGLGGAVTMSLYEAVGVPLFVHGNLLYHMPQVRTSINPTVAPETYFNFSRYHTVTFGLGAEYKLGDFVPFVEFYESVQTNSGVPFFNNPSKFSVGTRFMPLSNKSLSLLLGMDIGAGRGLAPGVPYTPPFGAIAQLSYTVGLTNTERKHYYTTHDVNVVDRKFVIRRNINFKVASAELEGDSTAVLDQIAQVIKHNKIRKLLIVGHTDSTFNEDYNNKLSFDRAATVKRYLVAKGIPEEELISQGYGRRKPKASNLTESGRALNRRVEFFILE